MKCKVTGLFGSQHSDFSYIQSRLNAQEGLSLFTSHLKGALQSIHNESYWQEVGDHLSLLKLVSQIADEAQSSKTAHEHCASLLTALHNLLTRACLLGSPQGENIAVQDE